MPGRNQDELVNLYASLPPEAQQLALDAVRRLSDRERYGGAFGWLVGYHYTSRSPGDVQCELEIGRGHLNPGGIAHGGVIYTLADAAMGASVMSMLEPGQRCVTAELKVNYLKAVKTGRLVAHAKVVRKGNRLATVTAEVRDGQGDLIAIALGTFAVVAGFVEPSSGK